MSHFQLTIRFLQPFVHARTDGDEPEWPPSPLRVFQALIAAAAARWNERTELSGTLPALRWLQDQSQPEIVACAGRASDVRVQFYVPDNTTDSLVPAWKKGDTTKPPKRTDKVVRPTHLDGETVHYLYPISDSNCEYFETLKLAARSITHLGWGIDMVAADADLISATEAAALPGERWSVANSGGVALRVPTAGTLDDLMRKHTDFLNRLSVDGFKPVPPLREFGVQHYRRSWDVEPRPYVVVTILKPDASGNRAFSTSRRTRDVAAWIRHAVADVCRDWTDVASFVHGHGVDGKPNNSPNSSHRFQYLPLPTINSALGRVESIRRVMVVAPSGCSDRIDFIRRRLLGHELLWDHSVMGLLNLQPGKDWVTDQYLKPATQWSTVTPVILDGFNDHNANKSQKLIRKALENAGVHSEVEFEYQPFGFRPGVEPVREYKRPEKLNGSMVHVRLRFKHRIPGPLAIGAGRYRGFGLFASESSDSD